MMVRLFGFHGVLDYQQMIYFLIGAASGESK